MNRCQFIFKTSVLALVLMSNAISFGMIVRYKDEQSKKAVQASVASCLKPIYEQEKEKVKALPLEEQGLYNLEKLYKNRHNPKFVQKFLRNEDHYVPVMFVQSGGSVKPEKGIKMSFFEVNPYCPLFYYPYSKSLPSDFREKFSGIHQKRVEEALKRKCTACADKYPNVYQMRRGHDKNYPLVIASLFGGDEDIRQIFKSRDENLVGEEQYLHYASLAAINYPNKKNNALELLVPYIRQKAKQESLINNIGGDTDEIETDKEKRVILSYKLLGASVGNKDIFEFIAQQDPYNANRISIYNPFDGYDVEERTTLDFMIADKKYFGEENIQTFIHNGGCTAETLKQMKYIGNIIEHLPSRRNSMTPEEREASNFFDRRVYNILRQREMERNQQPTEPEVD
jgi:hypothetical protein